MLDAALQNNPDDVEVFESKAQALVLLNDQPQALTLLNTVLEKSPRRELAIGSAGAIAQSLRKTDQAIDYWRRAVELNPWMPLYRRNLALLLVQKQAWDELHVHSEAWLRLDPSSVDARRLWVTCLLKEGKLDEARAQFAKIELLNPADLPELRAWFDVRSRAR
jgi:tetratricopeptide (TPR) repeat protein